MLGAQVNLRVRAKGSVLDWLKAEARGMEGLKDWLTIIALAPAGAWAI